MAEKESVVVAPTPSVVKSSARVKVARKQRCVTRSNSKSDHKKSVSKSTTNLGSKEQPPLQFKGEYKLFASKDDRDSDDEWLEDIKYSVYNRYAENALEHYKKDNENKDADFEVEKVVYMNKSGLDHPKFEELTDWAHLYFVAKPKNKDGSSSTHFLAELIHGRGLWDVQRCKSFEPSDEPGKKHDCVICGDAVDIHPIGNHEFEFGHSSNCKVDGFPWRR